MMKPLLCLAIAGFFAAPLAAEDTPPPSVAETVFLTEFESLDTFLWKNRPLVIFADSADDQRFVTQMEMLHKRPEDLAERDVVVITDTDPAAESELRQKLRPRGFMVVLLGKDGTLYLRKPLPWDVREISRSIDKMPTRQQEVRERRDAQ